MPEVKTQDECIEGEDYAVIPLGDHLIAWVSPEDADVGSLGWSAKKSGKGDWIHYYAVHYERIGRRRIEMYLHNEIWEKANGTGLPDGFLVDHINQDKLDNRRENLRLATRQDNEANKRKRRTQNGGATTSQYKGVTLMKDRPRRKPWRATITVDRKQRALGTYATEAEAARAYNEAAEEQFGEFAFLNEIPDD